MRVPVLSSLASLGLPRLIAIVLWASVAGVVIGYSLAILSNEDDADPIAVPTLPAAARVAAAQRERSAEPIFLGAVLTRAQTPSGQRRRRARLAVTMRLRNPRGRRTRETAAPALLVDGDRIPSDPAAARLAGGLLEPVPSNTTVSGVLRFETAGRVTDRLVGRRQAQVRIAGLTLTLPVQVAP